ncbi:RND transporter [Idiomarina sp.]|uniref:RND transporter n=1 Tax=Idiomarina sp. TaxID=1874361 RepID=UPI002639BD46|nr:RND transporter [Idiomarina sp.]
MKRVSRVVFLLILLGLLAAGLSQQLPKVSWQSSLADALPNQVSALQRAYLESQQPNTQQLLIAFEQSGHSAGELRAAVESEVAVLLQHEPTLKRAELTDTKAFLSFYREHAGRLATRQDTERLRAGQFNGLISDAQSLLQSPEPVLVPVTQDPLLLTQRYLKSLPDLMPGYKNHNGLYSRTDGETVQVLVPLQIAGDALSINQTQQVVAKLNGFISAVKQTDADISSYRSGLIFHADAGAKQAKQEMTWFGGLSLLLVLSVLIWVFRSPFQLFYTLSLLVVASAFGLLATLFWSSSPHVLMLVFATSFIGLCIDYVIHGFIARSHGASAWKALTPALWLGGLTTIAGYALLLAVPLPLLQQLGVFMAAALFSAVLLVTLTLPWLPKPKQPQAKWQRFCEKAEAGYCRLQRQLPSRWLTVLPVITVVILIAAHASNDSVRLLASSPKPLLEEENYLREHTSFYFSPEVILVAGDTRQQALERTSLVDESYHAIGISDYYSPISQQQDAIELQRQLFESSDGAVFLQWLGISAPKLNAADAVHPLEHQFLYPFKDRWLSVVRLKQGQAAASFDDKPWAQVFDPIEHASSALGEYRQSMQVWLGALLVLSFFVLFIFLNRGAALKEKAKASWQVFSVILLSVSTALLIAQLSQPLNLFHWIGAMFVLVLSIDYGVFCASRLQRSHALQAIYLSALTTLVAFGALTFSSTPAIAAFGQVVMVGVLVSVLFCPLITTAPTKDVKKDEGQ